MCVRQCERWDLHGRRNSPPPNISPGKVIPAPNYLPPPPPRYLPASGAASPVPSLSRPPALPLLPQFGLQEQVARRFLLPSLNACFAMALAHAAAGGDEAAPLSHSDTIALLQLHHCYEPSAAQPDTAAAVHRVVGDYLRAVLPTLPPDEDTPGRIVQQLLALAAHPSAAPHAIAASREACQLLLDFGLWQTARPAVQVRGLCLCARGEGRRSPSNRRWSPSNRRRLPSHCRWLPSNRRRLPSNRRRSPSNRRRLPSNRRRLPSHCRWLPSNRRRSPSNRRRLPSNRRRLPSHCRWLPSNRRRSPSNRRRLPSNHRPTVCLNTELATGRPELFFIPMKGRPPVIPHPKRDGQNGIRQAATAEPPAHSL